MVSALDCQIYDHESNSPFRVALPVYLAVENGYRDLPWKLNAAERSADHIASLSTSTLHSTGQDTGQDRTGQDRMEIGLEGHRMPQDTGWTRALYVKSQDKQTKNIWSDSPILCSFSSQ